MHALVGSDPTRSEIRYFQTEIHCWRTYLQMEIFHLLVGICDQWLRIQKQTSQVHNKIKQTYSIHLHDTSSLLFFTSI